MILSCALQRDRIQLALNLWYVLFVAEHERYLAVWGVEDGLREP